MLAEQRNKPQFSDITFMVQNKPYYAHKIVVSLLSELFRTMLRAGLQESSKPGSCTVRIDEISYECFTELMKYLYTGQFDCLDAIEDKQELLETAIEFLRIADVEVLDDVKIACELKLISLLSVKCFQQVSEAADKYNADRLKDYCGWFERTHCHSQLHCDK